MGQKELMEQIASADSFLLTQIVQAVLSRYRALFPDDEVFFLSLPARNSAERAAILRKAADMIEHEALQQRQAFRLPLFIYAHPH